jgi:Spy/CpxP family protein refolding chaperone
MLLLPGAFVSAQDRSSPSPQKIEQVAKQLNLTPEQEAKLFPILKAEAPKIEAIKANTSLSPIQKMEQLKAVHDQTDPQVKSILTPDQYETLKGLRRQEIQQVIRNRQNPR